MKIIIFGATETSYLIATELHEHHDITLIDNIESLPENFNKLDISFVQGNASNITTLEQAGIKNANIFIASTNLDEANIVASWTAKKLAPIETVCFVSKQEYTQNLSEAKENDYCNEISIDHVIWPEELLTQEVFRIITVPEAIDVEHFEGGKAQLFEYRIKENSPILNKEIKECYFPVDSLIVGITRDAKLFIPDGSTKLQNGDKTVFMGTEHALTQLSQSVFQQDSKIKTVAIIGGGNVGFMLSQMLDEANISTKLIEKNEQRCEYLSEKLENTLVLNGDGTDLELLEAEEIGESDVVVTVTNNDEKNLLCSLLTKQLGVGRVITRVSKSRNIDLFEKVGIDVAVSPKASAINELRNRLIEKDVDILAIVERGQGEVLEISTPKKFSNIEVKDLHIPAKAIIGAVKRGHKILIPKGNTLIREGDNMIIFTMSEDAPKVKEFLKK